MNIKKLETKLQTILEDDSFEINEKNINEKIGKELEKLIVKSAVFNDAINNVECIKDEYAGEFSTSKNTSLFVLGMNNVISLLDRECFDDKDKFLVMIEEIFTNQDLYDSIKKEIPVVIEIVDKLNSVDCIFDLDDINDWFNDDLDAIGTDDIEDISIYEYLNKAFEDFNNLFVPEDDKKLVTNRKEVEDGEGTRSN